MKNNKILIIVSHPDDEILGVGASIIKLKKKNDIKIIFSCKTHDIRNQKKIDNNEKRQLIAIKLAKYLKINSPIFLNFPGLSLKRQDITRMAKLIYNEILLFKPNIIFTHFLDDNHDDHRSTAEAVMIATRPSSKIRYLKSIYSMEIPSASETIFSKRKIFNPNYFIDVKNTYNEKLKILRKFYKKELLSYPNTRSIESIKGLMKYRGNLVSLEFAEAFEIIRAIE